MALHIALTPAYHKPKLHLWMHVQFLYVRGRQARCSIGGICAKLVQPQQQTQTKGDIYKAICTSEHFEIDQHPCAVQSRQPIIEQPRYHS